MVLKDKEVVFGSKQLKSLNIGDLVTWTEWMVEPPSDGPQDGSEPLCRRSTKRIGVISDLYIENRDVRRVAMAKVVPMNDKQQKNLREKKLLVTSLKLVSSGGFISGKKNNRIISE